MKLWHRGQEATGSAEVEPEVASLPPPEPPLTLRLGDQLCSARGCSEESGIACSYIDRRERPCPTAWCPEHRSVIHDAVYCHVHGTIVDGTSTDFGEAARIDLDNRVPLLVNWVAREMDADVRGIIESLIERYHEVLVLEPVRFVLVGVERVRTWERSWKMCSPFGVSLRLAVAVEERSPGAVIVKVNSKPLHDLSPPWNEEYPVGEPPADAADADRQVADFHREIFMTLARAAMTWTAMNPPVELVGVDRGALS